MATLDQVKQILSDVKFKKSCVNMGWKWEVIPMWAMMSGEYEERDPLVHYGYLIRCSFQRPDIDTGEMGTGWGRWWHVPLNADDRAIVMTAWLAATQIVDHEMMEAFTHRGVQIFNPHKTLEQLAYPRQMEPPSAAQKQPEGH